MSLENPTIGEDVFAHHGRQIINNFFAQRGGPDPTIPPFIRTTRSVQATLPTEPVGILGAGGGGLYVALILSDLGIPYKIIEGRNRVGGRLYTHTFQDKTGAPYNYFDVGAMRFPQISSMNRVFHLFNYPPLNTGGDLALFGKVKPFYFTGAANNDTFLSYNGLSVKQNDVPSNDPFQAEAVIQDINPKAYMAAGAKNIANDVIEPFATRLLDDLKNGTTSGWEYLQSFDMYSTRAYMAIQYRPSAKLNLPNRPLSTDVINWCETFDKSVGWYDRSLSETVLEAVAFGWNPNSNPMERTPWFCIDGGAYEIADTMYKYICTQPDKRPVAFSKRVSAIALITNAKNESIMEVTTDNDEKHHFSHVITTIPLPVMRTLDLTKAGLSPMQYNALRQLNYGPSIKIGMQFRSAWWTTSVDKDKRPLNIIGGQTYTDTPLSTVVYPSFGDVKAGTTTTLIASYSWTEDAERMAALITNDKKLLENMVLRELASIHNVEVKFLREQLIDTFAWSWSQDPFTMGAFAFFGPGKFNSLYTSLNTPAASGHLHFAGEAISVRHAWLEGAFDSAWRAVHEMLMLEPAFNQYQEKFFTNWGLNAEWFKPGTVPAASAPPPPSNGEPTKHHLPYSQVPAIPIPRGEIPKKAIDVDDLLQHSLLFQHIVVTNE